MQKLPDDAHAGDILNQLNQVLFIEKGFEGNSEHYYDPKNSFLNDVIDRKLKVIEEVKSYFLTKLSNSQN